MQDDLVYCRTLTCAVGATIAAGGLTLSAGGLSITAGGLTVTAGGLSITASGLTVSGGIISDVASGGVLPLVAIATSGTAVIANAKVVRLSVAAGATASSLVMPNGTKDGQEIALINENATGASTLIFPSATNLPVALTISGANVGQKLIWCSATSIWSTV